MFSTITEFALLFIFLGVMLILWPSVAQYPLPAFFSETIAEIAGKVKLLQSLPITDHLFWWIMFYVRLFIAWYLFKFLFMILKHIPGRDRSVNV